VSLSPKVALSQDFLRQLSKLPAAVQSKVMKWAILFQIDPKSPSINYEKIHAAAESNLKSVRIDQDWRGIVFKPDAGDVYVLLHVDRHDPAYKWAERRKLAINPVTGAMQIVFVEHVTEQSEDIKDLPDSAGGDITSPLFGVVTDQELLSIGVPTEMLSAVRRINTEDALDALQENLPIEAYEGLFLLAAGDSVNQVLTARETRVDQKIDTADFVAALDKPESLSRFVVVEDDQAMQAIMNAPLAQWRIFLHPTQHKLARGDRSGPVRVLGGAGTGKTVLAMHRAKWLAENRTSDGQKILFTTFTKNLAMDIEDNLKSMCSKETMAKIEVRNLDAWVHAYMRLHKLEHRIVYSRKADAAKQSWQAALALKDGSLDLSDDFYEQELEQVVLAQGITTLEDYRTARRTGRGVILSRAKRDAVWPVFEEYRGQLASRKLKEVDDAYREIASFLLMELEAGKKMPAYGAIVIDETQDLGPQALRLLRAMIPAQANDLFFVGDGHQRIYTRNRAVMSKCGIDIRGRSRKLYLNYRTTDEIRRQAVALLEGCDVDDLDDGHDETRRYKSLSHGPVPVTLNVKGLEQAIEGALQKSIDWVTQAEASTKPSICVVASSRDVRDAIAKGFSNAGQRVAIIDENHNLSSDAETIYFSTMHRAKGLEFDHVIIISPSGYIGDPLETSSKRKLLYVAITRAKKDAVLIFTGAP
jgi:mRNA-degrading endonuclease RelE of RelBE toxin-antitoxin system